MSSGVNGATMPGVPVLAWDQVTVALAEVIERLGKVAAGLSATPQPPAAELSPDWLVKLKDHFLCLATLRPKPRVDAVAGQDRRPVRRAW
jgi:hypothetical protein